MFFGQKLKYGEETFVLSELILFYPLGLTNSVYECENIRSAYSILSTTVYAYSE